MEKKNPLLPFAYSTSSSVNELPLDTTPRERSIIDENASSLYHTRTTVSSKVLNIMPERKGPKLAVAPSLKRKMGESFNENDDIKRRDMVFDSLDSEPTVVDEENGENESENEIQKKYLQSDFFQGKGHKGIAIPPSSPLLDSNLISEFDFSTNTNTFYNVPDSPDEVLHSEDNIFFKEPSCSPNKQIVAKAQLLSSDADFGIDRFNRFKNPSVNKCPSTDRDYEEREYREVNQRNFQKAKEIIINAFENIQTKIDLEEMGLTDLPDEIKDFDKLVIFEMDPTTQTSYQLYLTNNKLKELPPSLFKFTKLNVLGLRHNKLTKIPSLIKNLRNLTDLSIGINRLEFLPPQILELPNLQVLRAGPNPFIKVPVDAISIPIKEENTSKQMKYVSTISVLNPSRDDYIPSLKVLCLNKIASYDVSYQETKNWKKFTPKLYHNLIAIAIAKGQYDEKCSECNKIVVEPVAEVYEWWDILQNRDVPIKKGFCSGICTRKWQFRIDKLVKLGDTEELDNI